MEVLKVRNREYSAKTLPDGGISLLLMQKAIQSDVRLGDAREAWQKDFENAEKEKAYKSAWLSHCGLLLNGDVSSLDIDKLRPMEVEEINDFFISLVGRETQNSKSGKKSLPTSSPKTESQNSPSDTK